MPRTFTIIEGVPSTEGFCVQAEDIFTHQPGSLQFHFSLHFLFAQRLKISQS